MSQIKLFNRSTHILINQNSSKGGNTNLEK